jgi:hypothetical protein
MDKPVENYWQKRLGEVKKALEDNNFEVFMADNAADASKIVQEEILPKTGAKTVSWGGSMTFIATGLYNSIKDNPNMEILDTFNKSLSGEEKIELRRRSLLVDLFITGTNAITEMGQLVNLDMIGNRIGGIKKMPCIVL